MVFILILLSLMLSNQYPMVIALSLVSIRYLRVKGIANSQLSRKKTTYTHGYGYKYGEGGDGDDVVISIVLPIFLKV